VLALRVCGLRIAGDGAVSWPGTVSVSVRPVWGFVRGDSDGGASGMVDASDVLRSGRQGQVGRLEGLSHTAEMAVRQGQASIKDSDGESEGEGEC